MPKIKRIPGFMFYAVSKDGRLYSKRWSSKPWKLLKPHPHEYGHLYTSIMNDHGVYKCVGIHQLVMLAYKGQCPQGMQVRHLDGNPSNNKLSNLKYGTPKQNRADAIKHGTAWLGGHPKKWDYGDIGKKVKKLTKKGLNLKQIAGEIGISYTYLFKIIKILGLE